jgi:MFS superfamily sulfate permease-like transporter
MALLTGAIVNDLVAERHSGHEVATATAFLVGIYSLALGLLKLGFLLDFIPLPVLSGYVSAVGLTIELWSSIEIVSQSFFDGHRFTDGSPRQIGSILRCLKDIHVV